MRVRLSLALALAVSIVTLGVCSRKESAAPPAAAEAKPRPAGDGKIPITTASAEAKAEFLQGRELAEKLQITDSIPHYQKAVALDPSFAWGELSLANNAPTGKEFFEHLDKAVALADKASTGERLLIFATKAGANNDTVKQKENLEALVAAYPEDERAHFNLGASTSDSRTTRKRSSSTGKPRRSRPGIRRPTTSSGMPTGRTATTRARKSPFRNISS